MPHPTVTASSDPPVWFANRVEQREVLHALARADDIEKTHGVFAETTRGKLNQNLAHGLKRVSTKKELLTELKALGFHDLKATAATTFAEAEAQLESYQCERISGSKRTRAHIQRILTSFADFVDTYDGIVGLVKQAGAPYGNAAFETLHLLLGIVIAKSKNDKIFVNLITDLARAFPHLHILNDIYPTPTLEADVASVYVDVIVFARKTIEYYSSSRVRLMSAFCNNFSDEIRSTVNDIKSKIADVNKEAMVLLHVTSCSILSGVDALRTENVELKDRVSCLHMDVLYLRDGNDRLEAKNAALREQLECLDLRLTAQAESERHARLDEIRVALNLAESPSVRPETQIEKLAEVLQSVFPPSNSGPGVLRPYPRSQWLRFNRLTEQQLSTDAKFVEWYESGKSSLLFICGKTRREARKNLQSTCSWLSQAAIFTAQKVYAKRGNPSSSNTTPEDICIFYTWHPHEYSTHPGNDSSKQAFATILWSLYQKLALSSEQHTVHKTRASTICQDRSSSAKAVVEKLTSFLIEIISTEITGATIWIILDRADECELRLRDIMNQLTQLVVVPGTTIKILVTADAGYKGGKWEAMDISENAGKHVVFRDDWDQSRTAPHERAHHEKDPAI